MPTIRLAHPGDKPAIETIVHDAYTPYIARIGQPPGPMLSDYTRLIHDQQVYVVVSENEANGQKFLIQGVLVLIPEPQRNTLLLDNIAVAPSAQGSGLGRKMLAFAEEHAADSMYHTLRLYTNQTMTENLALYSRLGFVETHRGEENGLKRVYMAKAVDLSSK